MSFQIGKHESLPGVAAQAVVRVFFKQFLDDVDGFGRNIAVLRKLVINVDDLLKYLIV